MVLTSLLASFAASFAITGAVSTATCLMKNGVYSSVNALESVYSKMSEFPNGSRYALELRKQHYRELLEEIRYKEDNNVYEEKGTILGFIPYTYKDESEYISTTPRVKKKIKQIDNKKYENRISLSRKYHAGEVMFLDAIRNVIDTDSEANQYIREDDRAYSNVIHKFIDPRFGNNIYPNDKSDETIDDYDITLFPNVTSINDWNKNVIADKYAFSNMLNKIKRNSKFNVFVDNKLKSLGIIKGTKVPVTNQDIKDVFKAIKSGEKELKEPFKVVDKVQLMTYNFLSDAIRGKSKVRNAFKPIPQPKPVVTNEVKDGPVDQKEEFNWKNVVVPREVQNKNITNLPSNTFKMIWATFDHYFGKDFNFIPGQTKDKDLMIHVTAKANPAYEAEYYVDDGSLIGGERVAFLVKTNQPSYPVVFIPVVGNEDIVYKVLMDMSYGLTDEELKRVTLQSVSRNIIACVDFGGDKLNRINDLSDVDYSKLIMNAVNASIFVSDTYKRNLRFRIDWNTYSDINNFTIVSDELVKPYMIPDDKGNMINFMGIKGFSAEIRNGKAKDLSVGLFTPPVMDTPRPVGPINRQMNTQGPVMNQQNPLMNQWSQFMQQNSYSNNNSLGIMFANQVYE